MHTVELALRAAALAQLVVLLATLLRDRRTNTLYPPLALLLLGVSGYICAPLTVDHGLRTTWSYPAVTLASAVPIFFWYFSYCVFGDRFRVHPRTMVLGLLTLVLSILAFCDYSDAGRCSGSAQNVTRWLTTTAKLLWVIAAFGLIARDWRHDLVEQRRRLRFLLLTGLGCYIVAVMIVELLLPDQAPVTLEVLNMSLIVASITVFSVYLFTPSRDNVFSRLVQEQSTTQQPTSTLSRKLVTLMDEERFYARDQLTIDSLARELASTPHALRAVINQELGHRNFSTFVNGYRVREVARRMETQADRETPVLTLALDAGFRSMAPFNRAFKDVFKLTPSDYRRSL